MPTASRDLPKLSRDDRARGEDEVKQCARRRAVTKPLPAEIRVIAEAAIWEGSNERTATAAVSEFAR